jgi:hypothetical protein
MNSYYPQVIQSIVDFKAIIDAEYPEFEDLSASGNRVIEDAYFLTMSEERVKQWENILGIIPLEDSSISDRRDTVIARIRGQGKLNTTLINNIVNAFTGGTANSWVKDSVLYVEITPPKDNKSYKFANVEKELNLKVPAHLGLTVSRNYYDWGNIKSTYNTWGDVKSGFEAWNDVLLFSPFV